MQTLLRQLVLSLLACVTATFAIADVQYFGLAPPRGVAEPFTPAILAAVLEKPQTLITAPAFSPDYRRFVFSVVDVTNPDQVATKVYEARREGGKWTTPVAVTALAGPFNTGEGVFSSDGRWFYFSSNRPPAAPGRQPRIFRAAVSERGFAAFEPVPVEPLHGGGTYYPRLLANGDLAFTAPGLNGRDDLFVATRDSDGFAAAQPFTGDFNSSQDDWDLVESRDGRLRIWASARAGGSGRTDLWFSRRDAAGLWSSARNLTAVNTAALETAPQLSPDDAVLFFLRRVGGVDRIFWVQVESVFESAP